MQDLDRRDFLKVAGICAAGLVLNTSTPLKIAPSKDAIVATLLARVLVLAEDIHHLGTYLGNVFVYTNLMQRGNPQERQVYAEMALECIDQLDQMVDRVSSQISQRSPGSVSLLELDKLKFEPIFNATPALRLAINNIKLHMAMIALDNHVDSGQYQPLFQSIDQFGEVATNIGGESWWWRLDFQNWWWKTPNRQDLSGIDALMPWVRM